MSTIDQQFVEYIVKSLVLHPNDVIVNRQIDEKGVLLTLTVNPEDLGRVIGKRGMTAQSIRSLLWSLGLKNDARYNLKIIDSDKTDEDRIENTSTMQQPVYNLSDTAVEKEDNYTKKHREDLAELDDLDI